MTATHKEGGTVEIPLAETKTACIVGYSSPNVQAATYGLVLAPPLPVVMARSGASMTRKTECQTPAAKVTGMLVSFVVTRISANDSRRKESITTEA